MVKAIFGFSFGIILAVASVSGAKHFWRGEVLPIDQVGQKWGKGPFDLDKFKNAAEGDRAKMAYSLLKEKKKFVGKDAVAIRQEFGDWDGFYFRDSFPAYLIQSRTKESETAWQIVFQLDNDFKVADIFVHKNCCESR